MDEWDEIYCEKIFAASIYITIGILSCNSALYLHRQNKTIAAQTSVDEGEEKEIYYVHQVSCGEIGILSLYRSRLLRMAKKAAKGYQVIVDYEEPSNTDYETVGMHNLWEDTFEQPCRKRAKEVNSKKM